MTNYETDTSSLHSSNPSPTLFPELDQQDNNDLFKNELLGVVWRLQDKLSNLEQWCIYTEDRKQMKRVFEWANNVLFELNIQSETSSPQLRRSQRERRLPAKLCDFVT